MGTVWFRPPIAWKCSARILSINCKNQKTLYMFIFDLLKYVWNLIFGFLKTFFFCKYQSRITILPALPSGRILLFHSLFWDFVHLCTSLYIFLFLEISRKWTGKLIYRLFQYIHVYLKNPSFYNVHKIDIKSDQAASIKRSLTQ